MTEQPGLEIWTVYDHPLDYPEAFVARRWVASTSGPRPTSEHYCAPTLDAIRGMLPPGLHRLPRQPTDDPKIVETWL